MLEMRKYEVILRISNNNNNKHFLVIESELIFINKNKLILMS